MLYKNILIFTNGYIGEKLLFNLKKKKLTPFIAAAESDTLRKKNTGDISSFSNDFQIYEVNGEDYSKSKDILPNADLIICVDWKKDYFKDNIPSCPVYYMQPSLLPKYRGYGAISEQFMRGVIYSGITIYEYNGMIDCGDIVFQKEIKIEDYYKVSDFMDILAEITAEFILKIYNGEKFNKVSQQETYAFYLPKIRKNSRKIDFNASAVSVYNFIRAYTYPFGYAVFYYKGEEYKIVDASLESWSGLEGRPGEIVAVNDYGITAACGEGSILIKEVEYNGNIMKSLMINIFDGEILI